MVSKVTNPKKIVTDVLVLKRLAEQGIDKDFVEFFQDYAPRSLGKEHSPYAKFYRDLKSNKRFMVVSGLPMVKPDGTKIQAGWLKQKTGYVSKANLFSAVVQGKQITLTCLNDQPTGAKAGDEVAYQPQLFLNDVEQLADKPTLLAVDPINKNYQQNTLEWDYGICKRHLRIIEGSIHGYWIFSANPNGEVRIKYNQTGNFKLKLGQYKVTEDEEIIPASAFENPEFGYPITISDSATYYPGVTAVDGILGRQGVPGTWAELRDGAGNGVYEDNTYSWIRIDSGVSINTWDRIYRNATLFDTGGLPDDAIISEGVLSYYGVDKVDGGNWTPSANIYACNPVSNTELVATDYGTFEDVAFSTAITYANWKTASPYWNDFILNGSGIDAISLTGVSKFGLRESKYDAANSPPSWVSNEFSQIRSYASEQGSGYKPKLVATYTVGWAGGDVLGVDIATIAKINGVALADIAKVNGV